MIDIKEENKYAILLLTFLGMERMEYSTFLEDYEIHFIR